MFSGRFAPIPRAGDRCAQEGAWLPGVGKGEVSQSATTSMRLIHCCVDIVYTIV